MRSLTPLRAGIVYDVIDGQVLIIRSDTGAYYSLDGTAAEIWAALLATGDEAAMAAQLAARHPEAAGELPGEVSAFVDRLIEERLVETGAVGVAESVEVPTSTSWTTPVLEAFSDMKDLLLFDPIHEVGPEGWPQAADDRG